MIGLKPQSWHSYATSYEGRISPKARNLLMISLITEVGERQRQTNQETQSGEAMNSEGSEAKQEALAQFIAITSVDNNTAKTYLEATDYQVDHAVSLYFAQAGDGGTFTGPSQTDEEIAQSLSQGNGQGAGPSHGSLFGEDYVRAPIPAKLDRLYGDMPYNGRQRLNGHRPQQEVNAFRDFEEEGSRGRGLRGRAESENKAGLGAMFAPPIDLMFLGRFEEAQQMAQEKNLWLLVNLQSNLEFASHQLNRDTWSDPTLKDILRGSFIFLQMELSTPEGASFQGFYKCHDLPAIVVIDPITGSNMRSFHGFQSAERLMEELVQYLDHTPEDPAAQKMTTAQHKRRFSLPVANQTRAPTEDEELEQALALSMEGSMQTSQLPPRRATQTPSLSPIYNVPPPHQEELLASEAVPDQIAPIQKDPAIVQEEAKASLPPETEATGEGACRVRVRFPDGTNLTRKFLKTHTLQTLRTFCIASSLKAASGSNFSLLQTGRGGPATALNDMEQTLEEAGLANSVVAMSWV